MPERRSIFRKAATDPSRLTSGPLHFSVPTPSSDGKRLFVMGSEPRVELSRYDWQTGRFDPYLPGFSAGPVDFSHDRKWMAYVSYPDMTLWRSRVDGSDKTQLTFPPVRAYEPRWSPDGSRIAFMDVQFNRPWKICLLSSSGGSPELLVQDSNGESDPTWTPDGKSIVFAKSDKANIAIYRLDLDTKQVSSIPGSDGMFSPRMSPDGRYISALSNGQTKLMLFDTNRNCWSVLVEGEQIGYNEWSHDGKYVFLRENLDGAGELVRVRVKDRVLEHVLSFKNFPQLADIFAAWIGLTPDDAPILMRDRSVQEIYALDLAFH
jgi:WD40 repeat protein